MKFRLEHGTYVNIKGEKFKQGSIVESDSNLEKTWPNKFRLIEASKPASSKKTPEKKEKGGESKETPKKSKPTPEYKDQSDQFDYSPEETGLVVCSVGTKYFVFDEDDDETPLNKKPIKKAAVMGFIEENCEE